MGELEEIGPSVYLNGDFCIIQIKPLREACIKTSSNFLSLSDRVTQRNVLLLSALFAPVLNKSNYLYPHELIAVLKVEDDLLSKFGNNGYASLGVWESLIIGYVLTLREYPYIDNTKFILEMENDFVTSQGKYIEQELKNMLEMILLRCSSAFIDYRETPPLTKKRK